MRHSKLAEPTGSNSAEVTLVIAAVVCALTTMLFGIAALVQGGFGATP